MLRPCRYLLFVLPFLVFSCSQRGFDPAAEQAKLLRRDAEWADLATAGKDVDKIVSYWSDDAVVIFPGTAGSRRQGGDPRIRDCESKYPRIQNPLDVGKTGILARRQTRLHARH